MKSFFAIALATLSVDAVYLKAAMKAEVEQAAHNVGCEFKDSNQQKVAEVEIGAQRSASTTLGADQPDSIQCRLLSAASDWSTTDKIYELKATNGSGMTRSWLINPDDQNSREISIDGDWAA